MKLKISVVILLFSVFLLSGCDKQSVEKTVVKNDALDKQLAACDEIQKSINMVYLPGCYSKAFKENGWSAEKVKQYLTENKYTSDSWNEAFTEYYGK